MSTTADSRAGTAMVTSRGPSDDGRLSHLAAPLTSEPTISRAPTLPLRLYLGTAVLKEVVHKVGPHTWTGWLQWMPGFVASQTKHSVGIYHAFLTAIVVPHGTLFAALVALGELGVAVGMLLGVSTRLAAAVGVVLTANYALLNGTSLTAVSNDRALLIGFIVVFLTAPGRVFGVDAYLAKRWPRIPLW